MKRRLNLSLTAITSTILLASWSLSSPAAEEPKSFVLTVSLPKSTMHVGEDLVVNETISNPTDQIIVAGEGGRVGLTLELINERGDDVGLYAMGIAAGKIEEPEYHLNSSKRSMRPGSEHRFTLRFKPVPGHVLPGVYKLKVHQRDMKSNADVYSNTVELTVIP